MLIVIPRWTSSGARSMPSNATNWFAVGSASASTLVIAAVRVVLPWSTWPMVPMLRWGLVRLNWLLAMAVLSRGGSLGARWVQDHAPRRGGGDDSPPRVLLQQEESQLRASETRAR